LRDFLAYSDSVVKTALFKGTSAMSETRPILCGHCHVGIEGRADAHGNEEAFCPRCGQSDTLENAIREAGESAAYFLAEQLGSTFADAFRCSDTFKVTKHHLPERRFRFVMQME
jgi:hypothetical protein